MQNKTKKVTTKLQLKLKKCICKQESFVLDKLQTVQQTPTFRYT